MSNSLASHGALNLLPSLFLAPTVLKVALSLVLCSASLWIGYQLGARNHNNSREAGPSTLSVTDTPAQDEDNEDNDEGIADGDLAAVKPGVLEPCKLVSTISSSLAAFASNLLSRFSSFEQTFV